MNPSTITDSDLENKGLQLGLATAIYDVKNKCVSDNL